MRQPVLPYRPDFDRTGDIPLTWQFLRRAVQAWMVFTIPACLGACTDEHVTTYRQDHKAFIKELIYCEDHYNAVRNSSACRAAFKVNSELFPE